MLAAVAVEIVPDVREQSPVATIAGFGLGIGVMLSLRRVSERIATRQAAAGLLIVTALDILIDGLVLGAGFAAGERQGVLLAVALTLELHFLGLAAVAGLARVGTPRSVGIAAAAGFGGLTFAGAVAGAAILGGVSETTLAAVLAFGAVALMYLVVEELLVDAHEVPETPWSTALFSMGFLVYLVIAELVG